MRTYKFVVVVQQPNDEFGEMLNKTNGSGCDEVLNDLQDALEGFTYDYDLTLVEYKNND